MLDFIKPLAEKAIELLREGERKRGAFFDEIIIPLHTNFLEMQAAHTKTFNDVRISARNGKISTKDIASMVRQRSIEESTTWQTFSSLRDGNIFNPRVDLKYEFVAYVDSLQKCLHLIDRETAIQHPGRLKYYTSLLESINLLANIPNASSKKRAAEEDIISAVDRVQAEFNSYCADVVVKFLALQRRCKA